MPTIQSVIRQDAEMRGISEESFLRFLYLCYINTPTHKINELHEIDVNRVKLEVTNSSTIEMGLNKSYYSTNTPTRKSKTSSMVKHKGLNKAYIDYQKVEN